MNHLNIPNEERSIIILGVEIHHLVIGMLLLTLTLPFIIITRQFTWLSLILVLLALIGIGFITDQYTYCLLKEISDSTYFGSFSFWGGLIVSIACSIWIIYNK